MTSSYVFLKLTFKFSLKSLTDAWRTTMLLKAVQNIDPSHVKFSFDRFLVLALVYNFFRSLGCLYVPSGH